MAKKSSIAPALFTKQQRQVVLLLILAFSFFTRIVRLHVPERYIFDEVYHAVTDKLLLHNDPRAFEWWNPPPEPNTAVDWLHPPIAKYVQTVSMAIVGETSFGWRLSSALFGVGVIWLTYKLGTSVFDSEEVGLIAAGLASLDGLLLVQSRVAMNDIHVTFFILLTFWWYWQYRQQKSLLQLVKVGVAAGLAVATKWSGVFALALVGLYEAFDLLSYASRHLTLKPTSLKQHLPAIAYTKLKLFACLALLPAVIYVASYTPMFLQGKSLFCWEQKPIYGTCYYEVLPWGSGYISHFAMLHRQIWWYQTTLTATHQYQSRPWQWFLDLRPVWYHVDYQPGLSSNIYAFGNPALFWLGDAAVIVTIGTLLLFGFQLIQKKHSKQLKLQTHSRLLFVFLAYAIVWVPWFLSPRIMFFYHYTPAVPLLSLILGYWTYTLTGSKNANTKLVASVIVAVCIICFVLWYPHWTALPVPEWLAKNIYFKIFSWK